MLTTLITLVSSPRALVDRCQNQVNLRELAQTATLAILVCTCSFGLVLGFHRDASQAIFAGVKLPAMWFLSLIVCAPGFYATAAALGHPVALRSLTSLILSAAGRASVVLLALLPVLWIASDLLPDTDRGYHQITMLAAVIYGLAGLAGLGVLVRALDWSKTGMLVLASWLGLFGIVGGQTAWSLRPFVGRPSQTDVPFIREPEGTFLGAVSVGLNSARGRYRHRSTDLREVP